MLRPVLKWAEFAAVQAAAHVFCLFPVRKNRLVFMSHRGASQYSDSPRYITEYLLDHYPGEYEIIWEFGNPEEFRYLEEKGIKLVRYSTLREAFYLNTAAAAVTNCGFRAYQISRKNQLRINTWHGGGAYKSEKYAGGDPVTEGDPLSIRLRQRKLGQSNVFLTSCRLSTKYNIRKNFRFRGRVLKSGLPRNDIMFGTDPAVREKVLGQYGIGKDEKLLLLAPTWKQDNDRRSFDLNYEALTDALGEKTGCRWRVLLRLHHLAKDSVEDITAAYPDRVVDATEYPDVQELLAAADLLITDYSSLLWDYCLTEKPVLLYTPDFEEYRGGRGFNVPVEKWGVRYARSEEELLGIVRNTSMEELGEGARRHLEIFGSYERGHASETVAALIRRFQRC